MLRRTKLVIMAMILGAAVLLVHADRSHAVLMGVDLLNPGDKLITRDTATGLDWLDLTSTTNLSVNDILADVGGWASLGFTHAIRAQVTTLFLNSGPGVIINGLFGVDTQNRQPAIDLMTLIGITDNTPEDTANSDGFFGVDEPGPGLVYEAFPALNNTVLPITTATAGLFFLATIPELAKVTSFRSPQIGNWLVRPVPEPSTMLLLASGLIGVGFIRRRRKAV